MSDTATSGVNVIESKYPNPKYHLVETDKTAPNGEKLYRLIAARDFFYTRKFFDESYVTWNGKYTRGLKNFTGFRLIREERVDIKAGQLGGLVGSEDNLSHSGSCWISGEAMVYDRGVVTDDVQVFGFAEIYGDARLCGNHFFVGGTTKLDKGVWDQASCVVDLGKKYYNHRNYSPEREWTIDPNGFVDFGDTKIRQSSPEEKPQLSKGGDGFASMFLAVASSFALGFMAAQATHESDQTERASALISTQQTVQPIPQMK